MTEETTRRTDSSPTAVRRVDTDGEQSAPVYATDWRVVRELTRSLPHGVLSRPARELYHLIAGHLNDSGAAFVSMATLARESEMTVRTVGKKRAELEQAGLIVTIAGGGNRTNVYRLIDFRLSTPPSKRTGVTPVQPDHHPRPARSKPPSHRTGEVIEENLKERACACGGVCPPGKWRCTDCQSRVDTTDAAVEVMLRWRDRPVQ